MSRFKVALGSAWFVAVPFAMLHAPGRWQWLAAGMGLIVGFVLGEPDKSSNPQSNQEA